MVKAKGSPSDIDYRSRTTQVIGCNSGQLQNLDKSGRTKLINLLSIRIQDTFLVEGCQDDYRPTIHMYLI